MLFNFLVQVTGWGASITLWHSSFCVLRHVPEKMPPPPSFSPTMGLPQRANTECYKSSPKKRGVVLTLWAALLIREVNAYECYY